MKKMNSKVAVAMLSAGAIAAGYFGGRPLLERFEFARAEADVQLTRQQLSTVEDLSTVFRHVGRVVEPSVVNITVHKTIRESESHNQGDDQLRRFFREHGGDMPFNFNFNGNGNDNGDEDQGLEETGTGSGVIMDADGQYGYVLTNNHVAGDGGKMVVTLSDGRQIDGSDVKLLGADPKSDLAVLQIKADRLIPAKWGDSDELEKGDWVMAFGSPLGYSGSMTHGIVSALNRDQVIRDSNKYEHFIQVDAPINPGNSGGPLVNIHGEVVGINTAIATMNGGFEGIGFAIPSNQAKNVYTALKEHGKVVRGWLGVEIESVSDDHETAQYFGYTGDTGVLIDGAAPTSPASGKLFHGDVVVAVNGQNVNDAEQLRDAIASIAPNTKVTLKVFRDGKTQDVEVTVGDQPEDMNLAFNHGGGSDDSQAQSESPDIGRAMGMTLQTLDQDTADKLGISDVKSGAVITEVAKDSPAADAGLGVGLVITEVGKTKVHNAAEAVAALKAAGTHGVPVYVVTKDRSAFKFLKPAQSGN